MESRPIPPTSALALILLSFLAPACITTHEVQPPGLNDRALAKAVVLSSWLVRVGPGPAVGSVVRLQSADGGGRFLYSVRNLYSQDLGLVDALGRAYRYRPHRDQPELLGSGTVSEGVARILDQANGVELVEIPVAELEARIAQELSRKSAARRSTGPSGT